MPEFVFLQDSDGNFHGTYHLDYGTIGKFLRNVDLPALMQTAYEIEEASKNAYVRPFIEIMRRLKSRLSESSSNTDITLAISTAVEQFYALTQSNPEDNASRLRFFMNQYGIKNYTVEDWRERLPIIKFWPENERISIPLKGGMTICLSD